MHFLLNGPRRVALLLLPLVLSACGPTAPQAPAPLPPPPARPPQPAPSGDWRDWPITAGTWRYVPGAPVSSARYGDADVAQFIVRCDAATRRMALMRSGTASEFTITTSNRKARFQAGHVEEQGRAMTAVILNATDAFLDDMVFSRGRIAIEAPGLPGLAIPAWAEMARAVEDCRK